MYFDLYEPKLHVVARRKLTGMGEHLGLELPDGSVVHSTPERGTHRSTPEGFAQGQDVRTVRPIPRGQVLEVLRRVAWVEDNPLAYDGVQFNCEVFVNWLTGEKAESKQVTGWAIILAVAVAIRLAA